MPYRGTLSIKKAKNKLNYKPKFKIEKGIEKLISYYKKTLQLIHSYSMCGISGYFGKTKINLKKKT